MVSKSTPEIGLKIVEETHDRRVAQARPTRDGSSSAHLGWVVRKCRRNEPGPNHDYASEGWTRASETSIISRRS